MRKDLTILSIEYYVRLFLIGLLAGFVFIFSLIIYFSLTLTPPNIRLTAEKCSSASLPPRFDWTHIGKDKRHLPRDIFQVSEFANQIAFLGINSKPGLLSDHRKLLFGLTSSKNLQSIAFNEKIYVYFDDKHRLQFSQSETPCWLKPTAQEGNQVKLEMGFGFEGQTETPFTIEPVAFHLVESKNLKNRLMDKSFQQHEAFVALKEAKLWGVDKLFSLYAGEKYGFMKHKYRLQIPGSGLVFLEKNEYLLWTGQQWIKDDGQCLAQNLPVAKVGALSPNRLEMQYWDASGFNEYTFFFDPAKAEEVQLTAKSFTKIRQRTQNSISLVFEKKHLLLQQGDWVIFNAQDWKILRSMGDIEKILNNDFEGSLMIFDGIEKKGSQAFFSAHIFNPKRTFCQKISLPILAKKKLRKKQKNQSAFKNAETISKETANLNH